METPGGARLVSRAVAIVVRPGRTWQAAAPEPADTRWVLTRYVAPLAAIPAVCGALGAYVFGFNIANVGVRLNPVGLLLEAAVTYAATVAAVWLLARWIAVIAPAFGAARDPEQALKLAAYSGTAAWLAGVFDLYPALGIPASILAGIYSLYTLNLGLPALLQVPEERRLTFFATILVSILLLGLGVGFLGAKAAEVGGPLGVSTYAAPR